MDDSKLQESVEAELKQADEEVPVDAVSDGELLDELGGFRFVTVMCRR